MIGTGKNSEIFRGIVKFVPVQMMDNFASQKGSSESMSHNMAMLKDTSTVQGNNPISLSGNSSFPVSRFSTEIGITIADESLVMATAKSFANNRRFATNRADIRLGMFLEFASFGVFNNAVHLPSFLTNIPQIKTVIKKDAGKNGVNSGEALTDGAEGNPEPSRGYTYGRCNDYRRGKAPLITGMSAPPERDDIVYSSWKQEVSRYVTDKDGVGVTKPAAITTSCGLAGAGVVAETIAAGAYGLIQVYGLHTAALCRATTGGSITLTHGTPLSLGLTASFALEPIVTSYASTAVIKRYFPVAFAISRYTTRNVTGTAKYVFVKAL